MDHSDPSVTIQNEKASKLKIIFTTIGKSLFDYFSSKIFSISGRKPTVIKIKDIISNEERSTRSKTHNVTYLLETDMGDYNLNIVVKFAKNEESYIKELSNHDFLDNTTKSKDCIKVPAILYKSPTNRSIIYEGVVDENYERQLPLDTIISLSAKALAMIHGIYPKEQDFDTYKSIVVFLISQLEDKYLEEEILNLFLPSLAKIQKSRGATVIHGDFHRANLKFVPAQLMDDNCYNTTVYVLNTEFLESNKDRCEDIGAYFALPAIKDFQKEGSLASTQNNVRKFILEYDKQLKELGSEKELADFYPNGYTIDFHVATYILYDIVDSRKREKISMDSKKIQLELALLKKILAEEPFS